MRPFFEIANIINFYTLQEFGMSQMLLSDSIFPMFFKVYFKKYSTSNFSRGDFFKDTDCQF